MIAEIDEAILGSLKKGLSGLVPEENIVSGDDEPKGKKYVRISNKDFTIEESGMSVSKVRNEEAEQAFEADGRTVEFKLSGMPVKDILVVEYPKGTFRSMPDDFTFDRVKNAVVFRDPPKKVKDAIRVKYEMDKPLGESRLLKFALVYSVLVASEDSAERDRMTLAAIEALYRDILSLSRQGVEDIKLNRGYAADSGKATVLEYLVAASRRIDIVYPPIEKVEIKRSKI
jgi:hypothetical protein